MQPTSAAGLIISDIHHINDNMITGGVDADGPVAGLAAFDTAKGVECTQRPSQM